MQNSAIFGSTCAIAGRHDVAETNARDSIAHLLISMRSPWVGEIMMIGHIANCCDMGIKNW